jgi:hypothetical protein
VKKLLIAILLAAILVIPVPATALAAPERTMTGQIYVVAVDRTHLNIVPIGPGVLSITGTVTYMGKVIDATSESKGSKGKDWETLVGYHVEATESVNYVTNGVGDVFQGEVNGTLTIKGVDRDPLVFTYQAKVSGNIFFGPASDVGTWKVSQASGAFNTLKKGQGTWNATVEFDSSQGTLAGMASVVGTY